MAPSLRRVCVFCGSQPGRDPAYLGAAVAVGRALADAGLTVVFGGGRIGMMGAVADAALAAGGEVVGVIPEALTQREIAHSGLTELRVVRTMHERKQMMADLADAFVMLPGGFGTFEEFCEILTWAQLGIHAKPCVLLNTKQYFAPLVAMFDHALAEGFLRPEHRALATAVDDPHALVALLATWQAPDLPQLVAAEDL
jgi:hypothetical protein